MHPAKVHTSSTPIYQVETPHTQPEEVIAEEINEPESLNLNDLGRQMVVKALERNGGNRKKAAQELGISDRTLYRRIKQYGLDSNK
jgi:DNA-binding NtrC family response regulator